MKSYHKSVLVREVLAYLAPKPGGVYVDATFGGGGHTRAILEAEKKCSIIAFDWDKQALEKNSDEIKQEFGDRFRTIWGNFANIYTLLRREKVAHIDGVLADFGTSQFQIHHKEGFSFQQDTPLDMRMSPSHGTLTAAQILNTYSERDLANILWRYGEEQNAKNIVRAVVKYRSSKQFETTAQLVSLIETVTPMRDFKYKRGIHPATKTFQALRIEVNNELENITNFLKSVLPFINSGGRIVCISFHSLEDRLVKTFFKEHQDTLQILTNKPIEAQQDELLENPSSRSAKLRAAQKC